MSLTLVIGYKNHSSWSLRPWLYRKHHGLAFEEIRIPLYREDPKAEILAHSPAGKVPVLIDGDLAVGTPWRSWHGIAGVYAREISHAGLTAGNRLLMRPFVRKLSTGCRPCAETRNWLVWRGLPDPLLDNAPGLPAAGRRLPGRPRRGRSG